MANDGIVQVPPDSSGAKIDGASLGVAGNTVIRQRMVIGDNSASAQFATVTGGALLVQPNAVAISGTANVSLSTLPPVAISGTAQVAIATAIPVNNISATVNVALAAPVAISGTVAVIVNTPFTLDGISKTVMVQGTFTIGTIDKISATVNTVANISGFVAGSGQVVNIADTANSAIRVNVVAGSGSGANPVSIAAGTSNIGFINNISATVVTAWAAPQTVNNISATVLVALAGFKDASGDSKSLIDSANIALRVIGAGTNGSLNIGGFADSSGQNRNVVDSVNLALRVNLAAAPATVNVAVATPYTINNISRTVEVTVSTPFTINGISATVTVTTANPFILNVPSASHGPRMVQVSTSATATVVAAPGAGFHVYVTSVAVSNGGTNYTRSQFGVSATLGLVTMGLAANGGGFVMNFDPPLKCFSNEAVLCKVKPTPGGKVYFNVNYFVST